MAPVITPEDLRAARARAEVPLYMIAPYVGINPRRLGDVLRGRSPLTPELAERVLRAIDALRREGYPSL